MTEKCYLQIPMCGFVPSILSINRKFLHRSELLHAPACSLEKSCMKNSSQEIRTRQDLGPALITLARMRCDELINFCGFAGDINDGQGAATRHQPTQGDLSFAFGLRMYCQLTPLSTAGLIALDSLTGDLKQNDY